MVMLILTLIFFYQESRGVVQETAKATAEISFRERGILRRDVLGQEVLSAPNGFAATLRIWTETRFMSKTG